MDLLNGSIFTHVRKDSYNIDSIQHFKNWRLSTIAQVLLQSTFPRCWVVKQFAHCKWITDTSSLLQNNQWRVFVFVKCLLCVCFFNTCVSSWSWYSNSFGNNQHICYLWDGAYLYQITWCWTENPGEHRWVLHGSFISSSARPWTFHPYMPEIVYIICIVYFTNMTGMHL